MRKHYMRKSVREHYIGRLEAVFNRWMVTQLASASCEDFYIDYSGFAKAMEGKPFEQWPENYEGFIFVKYEFRTGGHGFNEKQIKPLLESPRLMSDCWWMSNRFGYHEFRVPIPYSEEKWRELFAEDFEMEARTKEVMPAQDDEEN